MFYNGENDGYFNGVNNFIDNLEYIEGNTYRFNDINDNGGLENKLDNILKFYEVHEEYVKKLVDDFKNTGIESIGLEDQILELFNNVKAILIKGDKDLIKNCIESIFIGRKNVLKFIEDQKECIDSNTLKIMNAIVSEYSHHINYLNEAMGIL